MLQEVDLPINSMVIFHSYVNVLAEGKSFLGSKSCDFEVFSVKIIGF